MFQDFKLEIKVFLIVALIAVVVSVAGILLLKTMQTPQDSFIDSTIPPQVREIFATQEECEAKTGKECGFVMCDYVPPGKTFEEVCGADFKKGWQATSEPTELDTSGWQTYRNDEFGFEVKYPNEFQIMKEFVFDSWGHIGFSCNTLKDCEKYLVFDAIQYKDSNIAFLKYNKDQKEIYAVVFLKEHTPSGDGMGRIEIMTQNPLLSLSFKNFADQVLSTFKFTNQYTELDGKVWVDVNQITTAINLYYAETKRLPKSLEELTSLPSLSFFTLNKNPITGKSYVYIPHGDGESFVVSGTQSDGTEYTQEFSIK